MRTRAAVVGVGLWAMQAVAAPVVFVAESAEKLRPNAGTRALVPAHIYAAKNEFEAFQIAVAGSVTGVSAVATTLTGPGAPITEVRLYREGIIDCPQRSAPDGAPGPWPDPLIPDKDEFDNQTRNAFPFDVPANEVRVLFVDVYVPKGQAPGDYVGKVTIQSAQGNVDVPVTLTVWNFELPSTSNLRSAYRFQYGAIPTQHGLSGLAFTNLRVRYGVMGLDHRISIGWFDDGDPSLTHFDTYFSPLVGGTAATRLPGAALTSVQRGGDPTAWWNYFSGKGWQKKLFDYTCDEPPMTCAWSSIPPAASAIHAVNPAFQTLVTTDISRATQNGATASIDLMVPEVNSLLPRGAASTIGQYTSFLAQPNNEVWMYQSCDVHGCGSGNNNDPNTVGWPSIMVDASGTRNRAMEWLSYQLGVSGELYYETAQAYTDPGNPWTTLYVTGFSGNGDGTLFYPGTPAKIGGTTHIPVASYRLKMIREGTEDWEYLHRVEQLGGKAFAQQVASTLYPSSTATDVSVSALMAARAQLAQYIVNATNPVPCSDGTDAGTCSVTKPKQCAGGALVDACQVCGCPVDNRCLSSNGCQAVPRYDAKALAVKPVIDGQLGELGGLGTMALGDGGWALVQAGWDDEALYLGFDVKDDKLVAAAGPEDTLWDTDGVEVMLDTALNRSATADNDDFHLLVAASGQLADSRGWSDFSYASMATVKVDLEGAVVPGNAVGTGYRVEVKVPWAPMGVTPVAGMKLGFDVAVNDRDPTTPTASRDWVGLSVFNNPASWGTLVLSAPVDAGVDGGAGDAGATDAGEDGGVDAGGSGGGAGGGGGSAAGGGSATGGGSAAGGGSGGGGSGGKSCGCEAGGGSALAWLALMLVGRVRRHRAGRED